MASGTIAVHVGGGYFKPSNVGPLQDLCTTACTKAFHALERGEDVSRAVAVAIKQLEDSPLTNAGLGSCLSLCGCVECDASIMDGRSGAFGAVGAVSGVKNPIVVALTVMETERRRFLELGRIPPMIVVGEGCRKWASDHGLEMCAPDKLITKSSKATYINHMEKLTKSINKFSEQPLQTTSPEDFSSGSHTLNPSCSSETEASPSSNILQGLFADSCSKEPKPELSSPSVPVCSPSFSSSPDNTAVVTTSTHFDVATSPSCSTSCSPHCSTSYSQSSSSSSSSPTGSPSSKKVKIAPSFAVPTEPHRLDTVGAVAVDAMGNVCAGCSSGGISLKYPGRVGQAGCYGSGCWAMNSVNNDLPAVAVCSTGAGEHIMKTFLARECALGLCQSSEGCLDVERLVKKHFISSPMLSYVDKKLAGVLSVVSHPNGPIEVGWAHSTEEMILGYFDGSQNKSAALHSCLSSEQVEGRDVQFGTVSWMPSRV